MGKKDDDRKRKARQARWERERADVENRRKMAPRTKAALRAKGCVLPFYDALDSAEEEFKKVVAWAKPTFTSLHEVYEVGAEELDDEAHWQRLGLPGDWRQVRFEIDDELAESYKAPDSEASLRGAATGFLDSKGGFHTIIRVIKNPPCQWEHKEHKYLLKLPVLLHEIGHVKDYEAKINFDRDTKRADLIEGEVFANRFALNECFRRAYYMSSRMYLDSLTKYKDATNYLGEVVRRVLERFRMPEFRPWTDYDLGGG
jgi:hypothetical protein